MARSGLPPHMQHLPRDKHGRPVPWFCAWIDGEPEFRVVGAGKIDEALRCSLCWVCGRGFRCGEDRAFVVGPLCIVNRTSAEPHCHPDCAAWSALKCPFLATPQMARRDRHLPEKATDPAGIMIRRNPGVALVWITGYRGWTVDKREGLFMLGDPKNVLWFSRGRLATRAEVLASIESGLPILREMAEADGAGALLDRQLAGAMKLVPAC